MILGSIARLKSSALSKTRRTTHLSTKSPKRRMATQTKSTLLPIVFAGPSGVGKGTMIDKLKAEYPTKFGHSVSHTTRAPRAGEVDGVAYHFVTVDQFLALRAEDKFVETAEVHGRYYGTTYAAVSAVIETGKLCLLDIDVQGCQSTRRVNFPAYLVFISPPSMEALETRLRLRGTETEEQIQVRLHTARGEMAFKDDPIFDRLIINDDIDKCYEDIKGLIETLQPGFLTNSL